MGCIMVSCVLLALDSPAACESAPTFPHPTPFWNKEECNTLSTIDLVVTLVFTVEAAIKIVSFGFIQHKGA